MNLQRPVALSPWFQFSHHISSPPLSKPVHDKRRAFLLWQRASWQQQPRYQASCISWYNMYRHHPVSWACLNGTLRMFLIWFGTANSGNHALSGKVPFWCNAWRCVSFSFSGEEFGLLGHSRGECYMGRRPALVPLDCKQGHVPSPQSLSKITTGACRWPSPPCVISSDPQRERERKKEWESSTPRQNELMLRREWQVRTSTTFSTRTRVAARWTKSSLLWRIKDAFTARPRDQWELRVRLFSINKNVLDHTTRFTWESTHTPKEPRSAESTSELPLRSSHQHYEATTKRFPRKCLQHAAVQTHQCHHC